MIKIWENGHTYLVESITDAVTKTDCVGCPRCHRLVDTLSSACPHCGGGLSNGYEVADSKAAKGNRNQER
jgi:hypothetical protein